MSALFSTENSVKFLIFLININFLKLQYLFSFKYEYNQTRKINADGIIKQFFIKT